MFALSLLSFAAVLLLLGVAGARGLSDIDDILMVVDPDAPTTTPQP